MGLVRKGRFLGPSGVWGCGLGIIRSVCLPGASEGHHAGEPPLPGEKNFLARSLRSQKCWAHMLLILSPKDPKTHMPSWPLYTLTLPGGLSGWSFPDPGRHTKLGAHGARTSRVPGRRHPHPAPSAPAGRGDMAPSQRCSIWSLC